MSAAIVEQDSKEYTLDGNKYLLTHVGPDRLLVEYDVSRAYIKWPDSKRPNIMVDVLGTEPNLFPPVPSNPHEALDIACSELIVQNKKDKQADETRRTYEAEARAEIKALLSSLG